MPTKVLSQQPAANVHDMTGGASSVHFKAPENTHPDDLGSGAEGRARKRFQKSSSEAAIAFRRPEIPLPSTNCASEARSNFTSRRKPSFREQKVPLGPRPVENSPSKRIASTNASNTSTNISIASSIRSAPHPRQLSDTTTSRFEIGSTPSGDLPKANKSSESSKFLPAINFDNSDKIANGTDVVSGEVLTSSSGERLHRITLDHGIQSGKLADGEALRFLGVANPESRIGRSNSMLQRQNSARQKTQPLLMTESMGPPVAFQSNRTRRQSHFPSSKSSTTISRAPRRSVGPGILLPNSDGTAIRNGVPILRAAPNLTCDAPQPNDMQDLTNGSVKSDLYREETGETSFITTARNAKAKSMQPPPRLVHDYMSMPSFTTDQVWHPSIAGARSPGKSVDRRTTTPSSGKRLSIMPGHATGLGARTISPTDARRIKRMSMMPNPPPIPRTPPTPQREGSRSGVPSVAQSPSLIPRKSITPCSNRTTPDINRKSYSSGISTSSNTSYNSLRTSNGSLRIPQSSSLSRLPTVKNRSENGSTGPVEEVPPVPAIPKAYESPKYEFDMPFYTARKSSLPFDSTSINSTSTADFVSIQSFDKEPMKVERDERQQRGSTVNVDAQSNNKITNGSNANRILQPLRLPPINLLPLSTPTANKIAALHDDTSTDMTSMITPPPRRGATKTPSTPMTASKASFFSRQYQAGDPRPTLYQARSSSSHYALRSEASSNRAPSSSSSSARVALETRVGRKAVSPYISSSLPKTSGDFSSLRDKNIGDRNTISIASDVKSTKLTGPRAPKPTKTTKAETVNQPPSPLENETASFGASLRRTLSLTRRRSSSKAQVEAERDSEYPPQPPKHDNMPPPKLPASATWHGPWLSNTSSIQKPSYLHSRRKVPRNEDTTKHDQSKSEMLSADVKSGDLELPDEYTLAQASSGYVRSPEAATSRKATLSGFAGSLKIKGIETKLDRDDLIAEEEMRKMALRRKDTESAAKELDELRRRAVPKDRVSPAQALRAARLNIFERGEIIDFKDVYFCGTLTANKFIGDLEAETANFGYDDERGDYNIVTGDHLAYRYEVIDILGKGSFGQVVRCVDHKTGGLVAIKIIRNKKRFHQQALVEVNILQKLREWDPENKYSMVNFTQSFYFRGHLCISTELLGMNLYEFIKVHEFRGFSLKLIRRFTKQLLNSLVLLKSRKVIHCDLKPENILLAHPAHSEIKVIDFGSSCMENEKVYTYIQSRFYRSPEVILGMTYGMPIDMWSLGCILAELLTGFPIFPGENEQEQLSCIMEVFGPPDKHLIEKSTRKKLFFDSLGKPRLTVSSKGKRRRPSSKSLQQVLKCDDDAFLDFITRSLRWDPDRRLKPDDAIHHEFLTGIKPPKVHNFRGLTSSSTNINPSPIKRYNSVHTPASTIRPLPDPPATSIKNGVVVRGRDGQTNGSPIKAAPKRHSTISGLQPTVGVKRVPNGNALGPSSSLPRLGNLGTTRTASGKPDFAAAAAAAATTKTR